VYCRVTAGVEASLLEIVGEAEAQILVSVDCEQVVLCCKERKKLGAA
jgi:hypothetical protein